MTDVPSTNDSGRYDNDPLAILREAHGESAPTVRPEHEAPTDESLPIAAEIRDETKANEDRAAEAPVKIELDVVPRVQFAMHANSVPALRSVRIENCSAEVLRDVVVTLRTEPAFAHEFQLRLGDLRSGAAQRLSPAWELDPVFLDRLTERVDGRISADVRVGDRAVAHAAAPTTVFTRDEWPGDRVYPELLAAFVMPNDGAVRDLLSSAGALLTQWTGSPTIDGYQRDDPESVLRQVAAIYGALAQEAIQYVSPPASFESEGQRVRLPQQIASDRQAACLDLSLFAAAALEAAGLYPIIVLVKGHAFCGAFLGERTWPNATTDDGARLRNELKVADLVMFDPTCVVAGQSTDFEGARRIAERHLADDEKFRVAVDVRRARIGGVRPMASIDARDAARTAVDTSTSAPSGMKAPDASAALAARARRASAPREVEEGPVRIEAWKRKLLDLSLRNRLLNLPTRGRIIRLLAADVAGLEDALAEGSRFAIAPRPDETTDGGETSDGAVRPKRSEEEVLELLEVGQANGTLYSELDDETLDKRLTALRRESKTAEEEGGSSNLYLAVGLLKYFETEKSQKVRLAPIVLVPVQLVQRTARAGVELLIRHEDPRINVTLLRFLEDVHGVPVDGVDPPPDDGSGLDVPFIFQRFREEITAKRGWEVLEEVRLGMFSFSKILIWRDLDEYSEHLLESPVARHLVETPQASFSDGIEFCDSGDLDRIVKSTETFVPMSADSSQMTAILAAAEGKSFVLIGPPGTGKSQTITNLITHCLATGKTVLFVSEKMAALEVVHRRLAQVGLEDRCLELHSGKANKKDVLARLEHSMNVVDAPVSTQRDQVANNLDGVRDCLSAYVEALHRGRPSGESVFEVLSRLIGLGAGPTVELGWSEIAATHAQTLQRVQRTAQETRASAVGAVVGPTHPLNGVGCAEFSPLWEEQAREALETALEALRRFQETAEIVRAGLLGEQALPAEHDHGALIKGMALLLDTPRLTPEVLVGNNWPTRRDAARDALEGAKQVRDERAHFESRYSRAVSDIDPKALLDELETAQSKWFLPRFFAVRAWSKRFAATTDPKHRVDPATARANLERMVLFQEHERQLEGRSGDLRRLFADGWQGERSDVQALETGLAWADSLRNAAAALATTCGASEDELLARWSHFLPNEGGLPADLKQSMEAFAAERETASAAARAAAALVTPSDPEPWNMLVVERCLDIGGHWLASWDRDRLRPWCRWQETRSQALDAGLAALVAAVESGLIEPGAFVETFERSYSEAWYKHTISADPVLRDFQSDSHERAIARFRHLDDRLLQATRESVRSRIADHQRPKATMLAGHQGSFLRRETRKQKRHRPIRTLFKEAGDLIRELRPCVLMSPLSVAQFLDPSLPRFDVVVFDEASQMPVWDAIGAIARGNQLIVVGDPKQLPPTSFFGRSVGSDDGGETEVEDLESVLDECLASNLPEHPLSWHYRSRHESLIAFSNRHYYGGKLITFPAAVNEGLGVSWRPVEDGVYDFGKSRTNRREADAVVAELVRRLRDPELSKFSIGVVTLSQAQQSLVEDLLDQARREHPELERFFDSDAREPVFVKNLENVQGDERDVILFTVCYGPDLTGKVRMNFGPLNKEGGWRRLNVAISRARRELIVFSTLRADQIDLNRTRSNGVRDLRRFLEFAERGDAAFAAELETDLTAEHDSPFEAEVCAELERRGWTVHRQVGCSGYRIDLAVVDPELPGRYLLGIECDGASYHSASSVRDRDKLRHELLRELGWALHRIWSTDWWENREREVDELLAALEAAESRWAELPSMATAVEAKTSAVPNSTNDETQREIAPAAPVVDNPSGATPAVGPSALQPPPASAAERVEVALQSLAQDSIAYPRRLEYYRATPVRTIGDQQAFYNPGHGDAIAKALRTVVHDEGPIVVELAARRVAEMWGFSHLKGTGVDHVLGFARAAGVLETQQNNERVLQLYEATTNSRVPARVPIDGRSRRTIDQIPLTELASLLCFWIEEAGPMPERDLYDHALRTIGMRKLGKLIRIRLERALSEAARLGWLTTSNDVVRIGP